MVAACAVEEIARWLARGLLDVLRRDVARLRRRTAHRRPEPRLGIIATQAVKACRT